MSDQQWVCTCGMYNHILMPKCELCEKVREQPTGFEHSSAHLFMDSPAMGSFGTAPSGNPFGTAPSRNPFGTAPSGSGMSGDNPFMSLINLMTEHMPTQPPMQNNNISNTSTSINSVSNALSAAVMLARIMRLMNNEGDIDEIVNILGEGQTTFGTGIGGGDVAADGSQLNHILEMLRANAVVPKKSTSKEVLERLEIRTITEDSKIDEKCSICLSVPEFGEKITTLECGHTFHFRKPEITSDEDNEGNCLAIWLKDHNTCPVCRKELIKEDESVEESNE